ncbi:MAG TPA: homocysteine S-methyltransferase [Thermoanaerobaculia bacterium]|nr:homocysteine S-methyltransferase [Thermoanaerobaculia bacterium]
MEVPELAVRDPLRPILDAQGVVILDGGLATTLEAHGFGTAGALWSARALRDAPALLERVHHEFLEAGADCIATATYQATVPGLVRAGCSEREALALLAAAVEIARRARDALADDRGGRRARPLVAASIGPFGAYLADGSEYRGDYRVTRRELVAFHRPRVRALAAAGPDLLAFETFPSAEEVGAVLALLDEQCTRGSDLGAWISLQARDPRALADGTALGDVVPALDRHPAVLAVGVNCVAPDLVPGLLDTLRGLTAKPLAAYPNSGERWQGGRWTGEATRWIDEAPAWVELGARLVGGCCRTGPEEIRRLRATLL